MWSEGVGGDALSLFQRIFINTLRPHLPLPFLLLRLICWKSKKRTGKHGSRKGFARWNNCTDFPLMKVRLLIPNLKIIFTDFAGASPICMQATLPRTDVHEHCSETDGDKVIQSHYSCNFFSLMHISCFVYFELVYI